MSTDRYTLNFVAALLCGVGSLAALVDGLSGGGWRRGGTRVSILSGLLGTIGSAAWACSAYQDLQAARADADSA